MDVNNSAATVVRYSSCRCRRLNSPEPSLKTTDVASNMKPEPVETVRPDDEDCAIVFSTAKMRFSDILADDSDTTLFSDDLPLQNASSKSVLKTSSDTQSSSEVGAKPIALDSFKDKEGDDESLASSAGTDSIGSRSRQHKCSNASTDSKTSMNSNNSMRTSETASNDENDNNSTCTSEIPSQGEKLKIASVIKKAKNKGRKLLSSRRSKKATGIFYWGFNNK
uniref:Suppressor protein SRP40-like n=1 Tax=Syphacia muris TaxID=451379 RepID=A0A0N5AAT7_9BILA